MFDVQRGASEKTNQYVLLEVRLPDEDTVQKYSVKRLPNGKLSALQVRGKREKLSNNEIGLNIAGEVMAGITPIDGSIDFADLTDKVLEVSNDNAVSELVEYAVNLATWDIAKLKREGLSVW